MYFGFDQDCSQDCSKFRFQYTLVRILGDYVNSQRGLVGRWALEYLRTDGARAFVSSANFTQRGQERNIEVGVLIENSGFASHLAGQWLGLIDSGIVGEFQL